MDKMLEIPKDLNRVDAVKTCIILGLTVMLYLMIAQDFGQAIDLVTSQRVAQ
ncbi:MAG: hypothetical protein ACOH2M_13730 [Cypionkella sp.]